MNSKGGKQRTAVLPKPVLEALEAHLKARTRDCVFAGRDKGHISTKQILRLLNDLPRWQDSRRQGRVE